VRAVEPLPEDAVYGRFGMRPLEDTPPAEDLPEDLPEAPAP
jgi:hypothetical protein